MQPKSLGRRRARLVGSGRIALDLAGTGGALGDARLFAPQPAQIVELGAADLAATHDLDRVDHRRMEREHPLDSFAIGDLADREVLVETTPGAADADAFIGLHARTLTFDHLDVHGHGVARPEIRNGPAGGEFLHLLGFELLDDIHNVFSVRLPAAGARSRLFCSKFALFLEQRTGFVTLRARFSGLFARDTRPKDRDGGRRSAVPLRRGERPRPWRDRPRAALRGSPALPTPAGACIAGIRAARRRSSPRARIRT